MGEDLAVDIVDQLGRLVPEVQLEILESREKLDKEGSQDYQECLELLGLLDPKENVVISVIPVYQELEVWDLQVELDLLGPLDPRVLVSLVHKDRGASGKTGKRGLPGGPGPIGPPGYCQFCDGLAAQANRQANKKG